MINKDNVQRLKMGVLQFVALCIIISCASVDDYWFNGHSATRENNYAKAISQYTKAVKASKDNWELAESYRFRAELFSTIGEYNKAIDDFSEIISLGEKNGYVGRGNTYLIVKKYEQAIADYSQYIKFDDSDPIGYGLRGDVYFAIGDYDKAKSDYDKAIENYNVATQNDPIMKGRAYENWKNTINKYIEYFKKTPDMNNQAKVIINHTSFGNIEVFYFDNNFVNWSNCTISVPSGNHSLTIHYSYKRTQKSIQRGVIGTNNSSDIKESYKENYGKDWPDSAVPIGSLSLAQQEVVTTNQISFNIEYDRYFTSGHIYKIIFSDFDGDGRPRKLELKDITQDEGIQM
jgi:tetratricopeptide (TPR) repeat protein